MLAFDMELDESQHRVIPGETITMDIQEPAKQCPDKAAIIAQNCKGVFGGALKDCGADICLGVNAAAAGKEAHKGQVETKLIKLLPQTNAEADVCAAVLQSAAKNSFAVLSDDGGLVRALLGWLLDVHSDRFTGDDAMLRFVEFHVEGKHELAVGVGAGSLVLEVRARSVKNRELALG